MCPVQGEYPSGIPLLLAAQVRYADVLSGIVPCQVLVFQHFAVYPVDDVQPFLVRHRKSGSRGHFLQVQQQVAAFFKQPVIPESNGREFFHGEVRVAHHRIEIGHINIADVTYQKDSLLYLACPFYEVVYGFQSIVVGLSLLVNLYSLLKVTSHVLCRCGSLYNFIGRVYNALSKVRRVYHCPLCFACHRKGQHCHE